MGCFLNVCVTPLGRLAPEGDRAIAGQKSQPLGAKASEGKGDKPTIGPKRGSAVRRPTCQLSFACGSR